MIVSKEIQETTKDNEAMIKTTNPIQYFYPYSLYFSTNFYIKKDMPVHCEACPIPWKGKDITFEEIKKKEKNKKTGQQRVVTKTVENKSFFNFLRNV